MTAAVKVYLLTYRRNALLPRALDSLLHQTCTKWVCELHNDDPTDPFPGELVRRTGDPRISYVHHDRNLGPTATFNLAFGRAAEPFVSVLEDDNWWEPRLLEALLEALATAPDASMAWANMWLWQEGDGNTWSRSGTIWPVAETDGVTTFAGPHPRQVCGALHSVGAMLLRMKAEEYVIPDSAPSFAIEPVRERLFALPLVRVNEPLANFALTRQTSRSESADDNLRVLTLLARSWLSRHDVDRDFARQLWGECRGSRGHKHRALVAAALNVGRLRRLLAGASARDLVLVAGWIARHPVRFSRLLRARDRYPELYAFLERAGAAGVERH